MSPLYHPRRDEPNDFHRTQINLFSSDVDWLQRRYGYGWTQHVRDLVHELVRSQQAERHHNSFTRPR